MRFMNNSYHRIIGYIVAYQVDLPPIQNHAYVLRIIYYITLMHTHTHTHAHSYSSP